MNVMLLWQSKLLEHLLPVEDPLLKNNLMTTAIANFVEDYMQEKVFGDM